MASRKKAVADEEFSAMRQRTQADPDAAWQRAAASPLVQLKKVTGTRHALYLLVSLWSLRKHYRGPVALLATPERDGITYSRAVQEISLDSRLDVWLLPIPLLTFSPPEDSAGWHKPPGRFNREKVTKASLYRSTPFDQTIYLDADTLPLADPSPLFDLTPPGHVLMTGWQGTTAEEPCSRWLRDVGAKAGCTELAERRIAEQKPRINSGVLCYWRDAPLLPRALRTAMDAGHDTRILDQVGLLMHYPDHPHVIAGDEWNWSVQLGQARQPRIMHVAGNGIAGAMRGPWVDAYMEAWDADAGNVRSWLADQDLAKINEKLAGDMLVGGRHEDCHRHEDCQMV